ncbi:hypothetical protein [Haladaptatus halobius]|uniref:hypothetical protein n=1 Tax=Haladaptatus halobius TaxID=2884875 RepID=UPI001D0AC33A|nr:hypothetical protein [Haladaptatus halobius]
MAFVLVTTVLVGGLAGPVAAQSNGDDDGVEQEQEQGSNRKSKMTIMTTAAN